MEFIPSPNFWPDRKGLRPLAIVIHVTEGSFESAKSWIMKEESAVSYHFIVKHDGTAVQFVYTTAAAWANGVVVNSAWAARQGKINPNLYTISIAYAGTAAVGPTAKQIVAIADLVRQVSDQYAIDISEQTVIPHNLIHTQKTCPGKKCDLVAIRYLASLAQN